MRYPNHSLPKSSLTALSAALLVSTFATAAHAAQDSVADDTSGNEEPEERIVVTGSRISSDAATSSPSPVQVITAEQFRNAGEIDITQTLRELPALQGSDPAN